MKITVSIQITVEENDGDGNVFATKKTANTGDNPALVRSESEKVAQPALREVLGRVAQTYPTLR